MLKHRAGSAWTGPAWVILATIALAGCGQDPALFNNTLQRLEMKARRPLSALDARLDAFRETKSLDTKAAESEYAAALETIDSVVTEAKALVVPDLALAAEFHEAYLAYFAAIRAVVTDEMRRAIDLLSDTKVKKDERSAQWTTLDVDIRDKLQEALDAVQAVQKRYAAANQMKLKEP